MMISYLIWNGNPEIFSIGTFALRWYGLLFALGFLISQQVLYYIYKQEGKPQSDVDTLTIYMVAATVLGARFGHVIFYQPEMLWTDPLGVILPFEFAPKFRFTGLQGLASHGGAFGILIAIWLYSRKKKPGQNYLQVLDRLVIVVALTGALIRLGNFFNSEIIGKPTNSPMGVVFISRVTEAILGNDDKTPVESFAVKENKALPEGAHGRMPLSLYFFFKSNTSEQQARTFLVSDVKFYLGRLNEFVDEPAAVPLNYELTKEKDGRYAGRVKTFGIARHPAQLYESLSCVLLFIFLFMMWRKKKENTPPGQLFGTFMVILWSLRFMYEFLKENQVTFEDSMRLNMGQILSIPLILAGIYVLYRTKNSAVQDGSTGLDKVE
jgi:phosphatidylglycerol---prolipoprotein diacylglyceryl transferase